MPNKTKPKCALCKKEASTLVELLMNGPDGYRRYRLCEKCAEKQINKVKP